MIYYKRKFIAMLNSRAIEYREIGEKFFSDPLPFLKNVKYLHQVPFFLKPSQKRMSNLFYFFKHVNTTCNSLAL